MTQLRRLWQSETGLAPILIGLAALIIYFTIRSSVFLSAGNITNLFIQATIYILLGMAEIWLLLMGDIDLSIGYSAGIGGCLAVILTNTVHHWSVLRRLALVHSRVHADQHAVGCDLRLPSAALIHRHPGGPDRAAGRAVVPHRQPGRHRGLTARAGEGPLRPRERESDAVRDVDRHLGVRGGPLAVDRPRRAASSFGGLGGKPVWVTLLKVVRPARRRRLADLGLQHESLLVHRRSRVCPSRSRSTWACSPSGPSS